MIDASSRTRRLATSVTLLALVFFFNARAQSASDPPSAQTPPGAAAPEVSWQGGELRIVAYKSTLAEVLAKVVALTGAKIEIPPGAAAEFMPVVELGPAPAREVIASLLAGTKFDYAILAADTDPSKIDTVLLMPRPKAGPAEMAAPTRGSYSTAEARVPPPTEPPTPAVVAPQPAVSDASPAADPNQQPPSAASDLGQPSPRLQADQSMSTRPGALSPPQSLTPTTINSQLQQMYQQRMQMVQQARQSGSATP